MLNNNDANALNNAEIAGIVRPLAPSLLTKTCGFEISKCFEEKKDVMSLASVTKSQLLCQNKVKLIHLHAITAARHVKPLWFWKFENLFCNFSNNNNNKTLTPTHW